MPSISMNAYIAVDSVNQFSDITSSPSPESFVITTTDIEYGGTHAALTYNMGTHTVSTSGLTYFAYLPMDNHRVFKIHFIEYSSGVLFFEYQELVFENQDSLPCEVAISSDDQELVSIITCDAADTSLYLNLVNVAEDTLDWHLSYRNIPVDLSLIHI